MTKPLELGWCGFVFSCNSEKGRLFFDNHRATFYVDTPVVVHVTNPELIDDFEPWAEIQEHYDDALAFLDDNHYVPDDYTNVVLVPEGAPDVDEYLFDYEIPDNVCFWTGDDSGANPIPDLPNQVFVSVPADRRELYASTAAACALYERMRQHWEKQHGDRGRATEKE